MPSQHPEAKKLISQGVFDSIKSFKEFEGRVSKLFEINTKILGDAFEIFVEAYLATQPIMQCAETYLVSQLPLDVRNELNLPNNSSGVDGVYKSNSGVLVPYQVKFRSNRPPLSLTEVATFLGLTERAKDRVLITNCDEIARDVKNRDYLRSIRGQDFDLLEEADFKLIEAWLKEKPAKRELPKPRPYQEAALKDIKNTLTTHDRATTVMACGTGKTLVALWAVEQAKVNTVLVLLPSLTLMQQTLLEWSKNNSWGNRFSFICVCSDPTVKANDEIEIDPTDIDFKVDTDPELVKEFLSQKNDKVKVVFSTYQSSKIVGEAVKELSPFDFAVFDEAHKTTGPKGGVFAYALDNQNISIKKRLFLTATPRHYDIRHRDKEGEFKVISMDDESIYGPRAHSLTFGSAANQGIICNYKVIISLIDKNQVDDFALKNGITLVENDKIGTRWVASQIALQQAIEKVNASKIITFHSRVKLAQEFSSETSHGIKRYLKDFKVMHVNGEQRSNERTDLIRQFKDSPKSLITNARCLTEGVDVPAVDMVAFIDARHSKVDIAQAIGRAMRKPKDSDKQFGYIVVPLFADTTDLNNLEETIKKEGFDDVAEILNALQEQDEELLDIIRELQEAKGKDGVFNPQHLANKVETIGPFINLKEIAANLYSEIVNQLGVSWDFNYGLLKKYQSKLGQTLPVAGEKFENINLGFWIATQRKDYNKGKISDRKIKALEALPKWTWDPNEDQWEINFLALKEYSKFNLLVGISKKEKFMGVHIGSLIIKYRSQNRIGQLSTERKNLLESLPGWSWDPISEGWNTLYCATKEYAEKFDLSRIRVNEEFNGCNIFSWIRTQRSLYKRKKLTDAVIDKINLIKGWSWSPLDETWEIIFNDFCAHLNNLSVSTENKKNKLLRWAQTQRNNYKLGILTSEKQQMLESLPGWSWNPLEDQWEESFVSVRESLSKGIPIKDNELRAWIGVQRNRYKKGIIDPKRLAKLNSIKGWVWSEDADQWKKTYEALKEYISANNISKVRPGEKFKGLNLNTWIKQQRTEYKNKRLENEQILALESLPNWTWKPLNDQWQNSFNLLEKWFSEYQIKNIPYDTIYQDFKLGQWVGGQRKAYKNNSLSKEKIEKLESLNFWNWSAKTDAWEDKYELLEKYCLEFGTSQIPIRDSYCGIKLGSWVRTQRGEYKEKKISEYRVSKLEQLPKWSWLLK